MGLKWGEGVRKNETEEELEMKGAHPSLTTHLLTTLTTTMHHAKEAHTNRGVQRRNSVPKRIRVRISGRQRSNREQHPILSSSLSYKRLSSSRLEKTRDLTQLAPQTSRTHLAQAALLRGHWLRLDP